MNAIRQFIEVKNNKFQVILPDDFNAKMVEIIIIPTEEENEVPEWQKNIVLDRLKAIEKNPELLIEENQFWKELEDETPM